MFLNSGVEKKGGSFKKFGKIKLFDQSESKKVLKNVNGDKKPRRMKNWKGVQILKGD